MGSLQQFGRALMLPTIAIPAAAILLWSGSLPWDSIGLLDVGQTLDLAGKTVFTYLPIIFAVGVALGLTESSAIAGMSALLGYFIFTKMTQAYLGQMADLGVSFGIMIGLVAAIANNRFKHIQLPEYIQFFGGPRFVPLVMSLFSLLLSYLYIGIGPYLQLALHVTSRFILGLGGFGVFLYGVLYRLLVPFGLHHILNNFIWFQVGVYQSPDGQIYYGDLPRFFAGDPTAGIYMAGLYPIMMFALPAISFAIIREAREDLKPRIRKQFLIAALSSFLTGVSEPIEFAFLFTAPYLYAVHALLSGLSMWLAYVLNIHQGFSYSAGAFDFIINEHLATNGLLLLPIGLVYGIVYYVLFKWAIRRFRIPTPGREEGSALDEWAGDIPYSSPLILQALGGKENISKIEACITRLRLTLVNERKLDADALRSLGAAGIIRLGGGNVQAVFGTYSELIREEILKVMRRDARTVLFNSPVHGKMIPLSEVPDAVFAQQIVGNGVAFLPERGVVAAPVGGTVRHIYPTKHAIGLETAEGLEVLLHVGIDTSSLQGQWFSLEVEQGAWVNAGDILIKFDLAKVRKACRSLATPMVITNSEMVKSWSFAPFKSVKRGQASVMSVVLKEKETNTDGGKANA